MSNTIKIIVKSDQDEAQVAAQKLQIKGYQITVSEAEDVVLDGTGLGGHLDILSDPDGAVFVVIGTK
jgi:hypothetical protein